MTHAATVQLADETRTESLGRALAGALPAAVGGPVVAWLEGPLGAGKTTLVRALLRALGVRGAVKSPSYTLLEPYDVGGWQVLHLDLYRLADPAELESLGLRDELRAGRLLLVEWPARGAGHLPPADLHIQLAEGTGEAPESRTARLEAATPVGRRWLAGAGLATLQST